MREFKSEDGKTWVARIHDRNDSGGAEVRTGWEVIQFDTPSGTYQKITYRPAGWLNNASIVELINALQEGETVRASWK